MRFHHIAALMVSAGILVGHSARVSAAAATPGEAPTKAGAKVTSPALLRYQKAVSDSVGSLWYSYIGRKGMADRCGNGVTKVDFVIDSTGKVTSYRLISNTCHPFEGVLVIETIRKAKIPSIPADVQKIIGPTIKFTYAFHVP